MSQPKNNTSDNEHEVVSPELVDECGGMASFWTHCLKKFGVFVEEDEKRVWDEFLVWIQERATTLPCETPPAGDSGNDDTASIDSLPDLVIGRPSMVHNLGLHVQDRLVMANELMGKHLEEREEHLKFLSFSEEKIAKTLFDECEGMWTYFYVNAMKLYDVKVCCSFNSDCHS